MTSRTQPAGALWRLWKQIHFSLCKLNQVQFDAPWRAKRPSC